MDPNKADLLTGIKVSTKFCTHNHAGCRFEEIYLSQSRNLNCLSFLLLTELNACVIQLLDVKRSQSRSFLQSFPATDLSGNLIVKFKEICVLHSCAGSFFISESHKKAKIRSCPRSSRKEVVRVQIHVLLWTLLQSKLRPIFERHFSPCSMLQRAWGICFLPKLHRSKIWS